MKVSSLGYNTTTMERAKFADDPDNVAAFTEIANGLVDDDEEDDDFAELERDFQPESVTSLYGAVLPDSRMAISCESKYATVWRYWNGICYRYRHGNSPYSPTYKEDQTGLRLYRDIQGGAKGHDRGLLDRIFAYLTRYKVKPGIFKWVIQFFNAHLKAEYYCGLHHADDTPVISKSIAVGGMDSLHLARNNAYKQHANSAEANYEDIQAEVHNTISNKVKVALLYTSSSSSNNGNAKEYKVRDKLRNSRSIVFALQMW
jgi:hypothetical protein